jgi:hypothetical protein
MRSALRVLLAISVILLYYPPLPAGTTSATPDAQNAKFAPGNTASLPSFSVSDAEGNAVNSTALTQKGKWLLLYMNAGCPRCDSFLQAIHPSEHPEGVKKIVVVVGKIDPAQLRAFAAKYRDWAQANWYADRQQEAFTQLKLTGVPVTLGINGDQVQWRLNGPHASGKFPKSALTSWLK